MQDVSEYKHAINEGQIETLRKVLNRDRRNFEHEQASVSGLSPDTIQNSLLKIKSIANGLQEWINQLKKPLDKNIVQACSKLRCFHYPD